MVHLTTMDTPFHYKAQNGTKRWIFIVLSPAGPWGLVRTVMWHGVTASCFERTWLTQGVGERNVEPSSVTLRLAAVSLPMFLRVLRFKVHPVTFCSNPPLQNHYTPSASFNARNLDGFCSIIAYAHTIFLAQFFHCEKAMHFHFLSSLGEQIPQPLGCDNQWDFSFHFQEHWKCSDISSLGH